MLEEIDGNCLSSPPEFSLSELVRTCPEAFNVGCHHDHYHDHYYILSSSSNPSGFLPANKQPTRPSSWCSSPGHWPCLWSIWLTPSTWSEPTFAALRKEEVVLSATKVGYGSRKGYQWAQQHLVIFGHQPCQTNLLVKIGQTSTRSCKEPSDERKQIEKTLIPQAGMAQTRNKMTHILHHPTGQLNQSIDLSKGILEGNRLVWPCQIGFLACNLRRKCRICSSSAVSLGGSSWPGGGSDGPIGSTLW